MHLALEWNTFSAGDIVETHARYTLHLIDTVPSSRSPFRVSGDIQRAAVFGVNVQV